MADFTTEIGSFCYYSLHHIHTGYLIYLTYLDYNHELLVSMTWESLQCMSTFSASNTGPGIEVLTETANDVTSCDVVRIGDGQFLGRCRSTVATHLRVRTRASFQICEVAILGNKTMSCIDHWYSWFQPLLHNLFSQYIYHEHSPLTHRLMWALVFTFLFRTFFRRYVCYLLQCFTSRFLVFQIRILIHVFWVVRFLL